MIVPIIYDRFRSTTNQSFNWEKPLCTKMLQKNILSRELFAYSLLIKVINFRLLSERFFLCEDYHEVYVMCYICINAYFYVWVTSLAYDVCFWEVHVKLLTGCRSARFFFISWCLSSTQICIQCVRVLEFLRCPKGMVS